jgi:transposase
MRKRRSFTPEFRHEAVRLALESERPLSEIARELGIRPDQLRHWKQEITRAAGAPAPASGESAAPGGPAGQAGPPLRAHDPE